MSTDVVEQVFEIINRSSKPTTVTLEPWAEECVLEAGEMCRISLKTEAVDRGFEIEYFEGEVVIHFGTGSTADFVG